MLTAILCVLCALLGAGITTLMYQRKITALKKETNFQDDETFHHAFDAGWRSALNDYSVVKNAYKNWQKRIDEM